MTKFTSSNYQDISPIEAAFAAYEGKEISEPVVSDTTEPQPQYPILPPPLSRPRFISPISPSRRQRNADAEWNTLEKATRPLEGDKATPTKELDEYTYEWHRRGQIRIARALGVEDELRFVRSTIGLSAKQMADGEELTQYQAGLQFLGKVLQSQICAEETLNLTIEYHLNRGAAYWDITNLRKKLLFDANIETVRDRLNILNRSTTSPYYPDYRAAVRVHFLGMENWVKNRLEGRSAGFLKIVMENFHLLRHARNGKDFKRWFKLATRMRGINVYDKIRTADLRRIAKLSYEGQMAALLFCERQVGTEWSEVRQKYVVVSLNWEDFRQWWRENRLKVLNYVSTAYLDNRVEAGDYEATIAKMVLSEAPKSNIVQFIIKGWSVSKEARFLKTAYDVHAEYAEFGVAWVEAFGRAPSIEAYTVPVSLIPALAKNRKHFMKALKFVSTLMDKENAVPTAARLVAHFGGQWRQWVEQSGKARCVEVDSSFVHDLGQILPEDVAPDLTRFLFKFKDMPLSDLRAIGSSWYALGEAQRRSFATAREAVRALKYENVILAEVAKAAAECDLSQKEFEKYQKFFLKRNPRTVSNVPGCDVQLGGLRFRRLDDDDPRGPMLGEFTNCCQHLGGVASSCAKHGSKDPNGAFFVVEKSDKIIAQSWTWRNGNVLCFDNIEALGDEGRLVEIYQAGALELVGRLGIETVVVGTGYSDASLKHLKKFKAVDTPNGVYTDADKQRVLVSG